MACATPVSLFCVLKIVKKKRNSYDYRTIEPLSVAYTRSIFEVIFVLLFGKAEWKQLNIKPILKSSFLIATYCDSELLCISIQAMYQNLTHSLSLKWRTQPWIHAVHYYMYIGMANGKALFWLISLEGFPLEWFSKAAYLLVAMT